MQFFKLMSKKRKISPKLVQGAQEVRARVEAVEKAELCQQDNECLKSELKSAEYQLTAYRSIISQYEDLMVALGLGPESLQTHHLPAERIQAFCVNVDQFVIRTIKREEIESFCRRLGDQLGQKIYEMYLEANGG